MGAVWERRELGTVGAVPGAGLAGKGPWPLQPALAGSLGGRGPRNPQVLGEGVDLCLCHRVLGLKSSCVTAAPGMAPVEPPLRALHSGVPVSGERAVLAAVLGALEPGGRRSAPEGL